MQLLRLNSIHKAFAGVQALKGVSFDLRAGEVHALVGENGAGKTTLIKIITGAHQPDAGTLEVHGRLVTMNDPVVSRSLGIAAIYQQPALFPDLTVAENIAWGLESGSPWRRIRWRARRQQSRELLTRVGATIDPDATVQSLTMPEQQLVEIAKALGANASMLIMDEPTASLSDREVQRLFGAIGDLRAAGVGIIYISHRLEELFQVADRVTVLRDGSAVATRQIAAWTSIQARSASECIAGEYKPDAQAGESDAMHSLARRACMGADRYLDRQELIRLMVGRELTAVFPKRQVELGDVVVELRGVGCRESGISDVNISVRAGEILGLAGLVGAGRTELARVLFGLTPADAGEVRLRGKPVTIDSPARAVRLGIAYVPEDRRRHGVILDLPVAANATLAILGKISSRGFLRFAKERVVAAEYVERLRIKTASVDAAVATLSGGNQQKVAVARWLATEPAVLILDEPTQGVDVGA